MSLPLQRRRGRPYSSYSPRRQRSANGNRRVAVAVTQAMAPLPTTSFEQGLVWQSTLAGAKWLVIAVAAAIGVLGHPQRAGLYERYRRA